MPGDRRQILSLLRLPIPPLQPKSNLLYFLSVNQSYLQLKLQLGNSWEQRFLQLINCSPHILQVRLCVDAQRDLWVGVPKDALRHLHRGPVPVHLCAGGSPETAPSEVRHAHLVCNRTENVPRDVVKVERLAVFAGEKQAGAVATCSCE